MTTPRRLTLSALAGLIVALVPVPSSAAGVLETFVVTYSGPPTLGQLGVLGGVSDAVHGFEAVPAAVVVAPTAVAPLLRALPGVTGVYPNTRYRYLSDLATRSTGADRVWDDLGWTGAGVGVAIIDAGVDGTHPDLCAAAVFCKGTPVKTVQNVKVIGRQDVSADPVVYLEDQISTDSTSGHGSHVAGIAGGWGSAGTDPTTYRGVAHGASIVGYGTGEAVEAVNVLGAFDHAITHRDAYSIKVINNSWGPGAFTPYDPGDPVNLAIDAAWAAGISVVFGAGNDGTRTDSLNMFSENPHVIGVGSGTKGHQQSFFSSKGVPGHPQFHPTVTDPGDAIVSVRATTGFTINAADAQTIGGGDSDTPAVGSNDELYYASSSGTSMAAPHASGVVALMQQAAHASLGRWLTPLEVRNILQNTATGMPGYQTYAVGAGFVNAFAATQAAMTASHVQDWVDPTVHDVTPFAGTVGPGAVLSTSSFTATKVVEPGATILDVMADWGPERVVPANTDVDIDLLRPDGSVFGSTFLACNPAAQPNGYSSYCSSAPNERLTVVNPAPGTWTVSVHAGLATVSESVRGLWSVGYPRGTALPSPVPASVVLAAGQTLNLAGQPAALTATVRTAAGLPLVNVAVSWTSSGTGALGRVTSVTDSYGRVRAQATSSATGTQVVTVAAGAASTSLSLTWLGVSVPALPCLVGCSVVSDSTGKASVGGWWTASGSKQHLAATADHRSGATTSTGELSYHAGSTTVRGSGVEHLVISGSKATVTGTATVNDQAGYRYTLTITDNGEPGSSDTVQLKVTKTGATWSLTVGGTLAGGNAQVQSG
ncbi:MAG TPA: S8 family serine peptidase [Mycobacteriales bacterium]|nr:S8 family serine peptidase [Mycobacteriales bacterium]